MSGAVQQGPHVGLVPPGDVYYQHACRQTHRSVTLLFADIEAAGTA